MSDYIPDNTTPRGRWRNDNRNLSKAPKDIRRKLAKLRYPEAVFHEETDKWWLDLLSPETRARLEASR